MDRLQRQEHLERTGSALQMAQLGFPMVLCDDHGHILGATDSAWLLLAQVEMPRDGGGRLPAWLWEGLSSRPEGESALVCPEVPGAPAVRFRRHLHTDHEWLVLLEVDPAATPAQSRALERSLRFQELGGVATMIGKELLKPLQQIADAAARAEDELSGLGEGAPPRGLSEAERDCLGQLQTIVEVLEFLEQGPYTEGEVSLTSCLRHVHEELETALCLGNHRICYEIAPEADRLRGHRVAVEYVLRQLLRNAFEASSDPALVRVKAEVDRVEQRVRVEVWDNGPGIPPAMRPHLFSLMQTTKPGHPGLGLASARALVRDMDGRLAEQPVKRGACFVLSLPVGRPLRRSQR